MNHNLSILFIILIKIKNDKIYEKMFCNIIIKPTENRIKLIENGYTKVNKMYYNKSIRSKEKANRIYYNYYPNHTGINWDKDKFYKNLLD